MSRFTLIGMNNPYRPEPLFALYPVPVGSAGNRIWRMMNAQHPDFTMSEYRDVFDRRNMVVGEWDRVRASVQAAEWLRDGVFDGGHVVLLGKEVITAFRVAGLDITTKPQFKFCAPRGKTGGHWCHVPHPSGRSHAWNDPVVKAEAEKFFHSLVMTARTAARGQ